jgi:uncharacterized protein
VVAPAQFRVPPHPKVVHLDLPLMRAEPAAVAQASDAWRPRLEGLPRPLTGVLVGGRTKPYLFDAAVAGRLADELERLRGRDGGGTLYVTTSRRTQPEIAAVLRERLPPPEAVLYDWAAEGGADNPYLALLGLADRLVVTGDSVSMMVEAASLGRPLAIFALPVGGGVGGLVARLAGRLPEPGQPAGGAAARLTHLGHRLGLFGYARDLTAVHRTLYAKGLAVPLGEPFPPPRGRGDGLADEIGPLAARIRALVA